MSANTNNKACASREDWQGDAFAYPANSGQLTLTTDDLETWRGKERRRARRDRNARDKRRQY